MLQNNKWVNNEMRKEIKRYLETNENENTATQKPMGHSKSNPKREIHSNTGIPQETRKTSKKQSNLKLKGTRKEKQSPK